MISRFFIDRPVLANVLGILFVLLGGVALANLPVARFPDIVPPSVSVTATYPGASADTIVKNVALPIELQVNGVERMIYMQSTSTDAGTYTLTVTFDVGTDVNFDPAGGAPGLRSAGQSDAFVAKYGPDGVLFRR